MALLRLLRDTGLRASEAAALDVADYEPPPAAGLPAVLRIRHGKGGAGASAHCSATTAGAIADMLDDRPGARELAAYEAVPLFTSRVLSSLAHLPGSGRMHVDEMQAVVKRCAHYSGDPVLASRAERITVHDLRRGMATALLDEGASPSEVAAWGRWSSLDTLHRHYDRNRAGRAAAAHGRAFGINARTDAAAGTSDSEASSMPTR